MSWYGAAAGRLADAMTSPDPDAGAAPAPATEPPLTAPPLTAPAPAERVLPEPVLPEQSREDTDAGWGEYPESARDRLYRDRPPHWDDV